MKVRDAMHQGATWCPPDAPLNDIARKMRDEDIGAVPICENEKLIGMVTDRDIAVRGLADGRDVNSLCARDIMTAKVIYCTCEEDVDDAAHLMEQNEIRRLPVVDDNNRLCGMLSLGDIADCAGRSLTGEVMSAVAHHHP